MNQTILDNFLALCAIPHKSHHQERPSRYLYERARGRGLEARRDGAGNVIIDKPASPGREGAPRVILQAHMDMVTVWEEGKIFDPLRDPIRTVCDGRTLKADGTSLGGDDGAGVAIAMAILEDPAAVHGPLRAIFTVDEEDGMSGAGSLDARYLDAAYLINLDWEEYGSLCCSSAGSEEYAFRLAPAWERGGGAAFELRVQGLTGGHSGSAIHFGRANAIRLLSGLLRGAAEAGIPVRLAAFAGGSAHNAIPSSARAAAVVPAADAGRFRVLVRELADAALRRCAATDPAARADLTALDAVPDRVLSAGQTAAWMEMMTTVFDGVHTMSAAIPTLVESSANLGTAALTEDGAAFDVHQRSSDPAVTDRMREEYRRNARAFGFAMTVESSSPPWPVRPDSRLRELCVRTFRAREGREMRVEPIHAGLECGSFSDKNPALDIVSIGPDILDIHSPRETLVLETVDGCWGLVTDLLRAISEE